MVIRTIIENRTLVPEVVLMRANLATVMVTARTVILTVIVTAVQIFAIAIALSWSTSMATDTR